MRYFSPRINLELTVVQGWNPEKEESLHVLFGYNCQPLGSDPSFFPHVWHTTIWHDLYIPYIPHEGQVLQNHSHPWMTYVTQWVSYSHKWMWVSASSFPLRFYVSTWRQVKNIKRVRLLKDPLHVLHVDTWPTGLFCQMSGLLWPRDQIKSFWNLVCG